PIKRPYIWDFAPSASVVRLCLQDGARVFLLEWKAASRDNVGAGLADYAGRFIGDALEMVLGATSGQKPILVGHSLGGTFAAIFAASRPEALRGLVLLGAPLCFEPRSTQFRDSVVAMASASHPDTDIVPGSFLSQISAIAAPSAFVWSRLADARFGAEDPKILQMQGRIERWSLDEAALSGRLVRDILRLLLEEDRFCHGTLQIGRGVVGPGNLRLPMLVVVNSADQVAPLASISRVLEAVDPAQLRVIRCPGEAGVGLQHLAVLVGRSAHSVLWPEILSWLNSLP
ncbi:MAG: alpha/beta fold hydrolase, partial [Alphaproteobacteria bacterium]